MIVEKMRCPDCGSDDYEEWYMDSNVLECQACGGLFPKQLEECECGSNSFILLQNGLYVCDKCHCVYDETGEQIDLICQECGCTMLNFLSENDDECFECVDCGKKYDISTPEVYY